MKTNDPELIQWTRKLRKRLIGVKYGNGGRAGDGQLKFGNKYLKTWESEKIKSGKCLLITYSLSLSLSLSYFQALFGSCARCWAKFIINIWQLDICHLKRVNIFLSQFKQFSHFCLMQLIVRCWPDFVDQLEEMKRKCRASKDFSTLHIVIIVYRLGAIKRWLSILSFWSLLLF